MKPPLFNCHETIVSVRGKDIPAVRDNVPAMAFTTRPTDYNNAGVITESIEDMLENNERPGPGQESATMEFSVQVLAEHELAKTDIIIQTDQSSMTKESVTNKPMMNRMIHNTRQTRNFMATNTMTSGLKRSDQIHASTTNIVNENLLAEDFVKHYTRLVITSLRRRDKK